MVCGVGVISGNLFGMFLFWAIMMVLRSYGSGVRGGSTVSWEERVGPVGGYRADDTNACDPT